VVELVETTMRQRGFDKLNHRSVASVMVLQLDLKYRVKFAVGVTKTTQKA
jgi:hypothetical protein